MYIYENICIYIIRLNVCVSVCTSIGQKGINDT